MFANSDLRKNQELEIKGKHAFGLYEIEAADPPEVYMFT